MRLTEFEHKAIKETFLEIFGEGKIFLFGSRVDDNRRGGDIDLFIEIKKEKQKNLTDKKITFLLNLKEKIGEQKIDVIISSESKNSLEKEAKNTGIEL